MTEIGIAIGALGFVAGYLTASFVVRKEREEMVSFIHEFDRENLRLTKELLAMQRNHGVFPRREPPRA